MRSTTATDASRGVLARRIDHRVLAPLMGLTAVCGALVFREPSPYELVLLPAGLLLFAFGLPLRRSEAPLLLLTVLLIAGAFLGLPSVRYDSGDAVQFVLVTAFLALSTVIFAAFVADDPWRNGRLVVGGTVIGGAIASLAAVAGYVGGIGTFLLFDRARGTFEDPNVLGAFLILPACACLAAALTRNARFAPLTMALLGLTTLALFLSFSRAAWGLLVICGSITVFFAYATSGDGRERRRIALLAAGAVVMAVVGLAVALTVPATADLIAERARFTQSYDAAYLGRFDRWSDGLMIVLEHPLGFGAIQFRQYYPEEIHNVYLNAYLGYGWIGGTAYLVAVLWSLAKCLRLLQRRDGLRVLTIPVAASFIGMAIEGLVIDTDHWRHFFLLMGLVWGLDRRALDGGLRRTTYSA